MGAERSEGGWGGAVKLLKKIPRRRGSSNRVGSNARVGEGAIRGIPQCTTVVAWMHSQVTKKGQGTRRVSNVFPRHARVIVRPSKLRPQYFLFLRDAAISTQPYSDQAPLHLRRNVSHSKVAGDLVAEETVFSLVAG